ncbi:MAG: CocE/NonD family hydrolase, partial [SAR202 cluster bacterium]|nr:CocE/NonD family hydrolase [SAR202 cluster bacterium]
MKISQPEYDVAKRSNVMVTMRDGVGLAADLYFPMRAGEIVTSLLPAIMERTPYDKERGALRDDAAQYFASRGYVVIYQDTRGRFKSEGEFVKYLSEPNDG